MKTHHVRILTILLTIVAAAVVGSLMLGGCGTATATADTSSSTITTSASGTVSSSSNGSWTSPAEQVAAVAGPSVVNVRVTGTVSSPFFGNQPYEGVGSGVIYSADGYIITNAHVVSENGQAVDTVEVTFNSGDTAAAKIVAVDSFTDIAVIKVDKTGLTPANFADDGSVTIGEYAIAIGSPLDYSNSVTLGIVSGLGRSIENAGSTALVDLIQTDAAISPGNSGGALLDAEGRVIGINVAYIPPDTSGAENIGFAIPAETAVSVAQELITNGYASHAYLGIGYVAVDSTVQQRYNLATDTGILVTQVAAQSPAAAAGLQEGDIIVSLNGTTVASDADLILILRELSPGDKLPVTVNRNGQTLNLTITVGEASASTSGSTSTT
jgi:S1-C subfamily serine protease